MAQVDFTNARIEVDSSSQGNPISNGDVSLANAEFLNTREQAINTNHLMTKLVSQRKQLIYQYSGTFTESGTYFFIRVSPAVWKVSNITFSTGDTYIFQIQADLICQ